ncbi:MAG TPA: OmpA family protein [Gemmatimonadales bacterium]|nr:OmpA family protein [Gemmatimonadales bacterium]
MGTRHRMVSVATSVAALTFFGLNGCATHAATHTETGTVASPPSSVVTSGSASGSVRRASAHTARDAIQSATVGGTAGALISARMDRQAKELARTLPGAKVERVGEGIQVTFESGLLYDTDSDVVRAEARKNLRALAASLNKYPGSSVVVVGHTDQVGPAAYNRGLSERRAAAAADYLVVHGLNRDRVTTRGMGELEPIASNETERGRELNRRVEIAIFASKEYREEIAQR